MTARDDAIATMMPVLNIPIVQVYDNELGAALDAIPDDLLVRLAIERGALRSVVIASDGETVGCFGRNTDGFDDDDYFDPENEPLYRQMTP